MSISIMSQSSRLQLGQTAMRPRPKTVQQPSLLPGQARLKTKIVSKVQKQKSMPILSDLPRWKEWNTVYPQISGLLRIQQKLEIGEVFPGQPNRVIRPMVVDWVPNEQILWAHTEAMGLVKRIRYIEIEHLNDDDSNCILSNGEVYDGLLGPRVGKARRRWLKKGFEQLNADIVARVKAVAEGRAVAEGDRG